jgi:hypothetical protein
MMTLFLIGCRYAGKGRPPAALHEGAAVYSVPRLSTFLLPDDVVSNPSADRQAGFVERIIGIITADVLSSSLCSSNKVVQRLA